MHSQSACVYLELSWTEVKELILGLAVNGLLLNFSAKIGKLNIWVNVIGQRKNTVTYLHMLSTVLAWFSSSEWMFWLVLMLKLVHIILTSHAHACSYNSDKPYTRLFIEFWLSMHMLVCRILTCCADACSSNSDMSCKCLFI